MNRAVWKYKLETGHVAKTELHIPVNSKLLHIGYQPHYLYAWFEIDLREQYNKETRTLYTMHTGGTFKKNDLQFIQTVICSPTYVLHVYEKVKDKFLTDNDMRL